MSSTKWFDHKDPEDIIMLSQTYFYLFMPKAQQIATQQGLMHRMNIVFTCTVVVFKTGNSG